MPSAPQSPLTGLTVMPQQGQPQDQGHAAAAAAAAQAAAQAQAAAAAQYQVYEPQLQFAQSKCLGLSDIWRPHMFTFELD